MAPLLHRKDGGVRGTVNVSPEMRVAYELQRAGYSLATLAARFGKSTYTISSWLEKVRAHDEDERNMRKLTAVRRSGSY